MAFIFYFTRLLESCRTQINTGLQFFYPSSSQPYSGVSGASKQTGGIWLASLTSKTVSVRATGLTT